METVKRFWHSCDVFTRFVLVAHPVLLTTILLARFVFHWIPV